MKTFTLNGKTYPREELGYNSLCDFEEMGISISDIKDKSMSFIRAYIAMCLNVDPKVAGKEIEAHLMNGGTMKVITDAVNDAVENSGFFRALQKGEEQETSTGKTAAKS